MKAETRPHTGAAERRVQCSAAQWAANAAERWALHSTTVHRPHVAIPTPSVAVDSGGRPQHSSANGEVEEVAIEPISPLAAPSTSGEGENPPAHWMYHQPAGPVALGADPTASASPHLLAATIECRALFGVSSSCLHCSSSPPPPLCPTRLCTGNATWRCRLPAVIGKEWSILRRDGAPGHYIRPRGAQCEGAEGWMAPAWG